MLVKCKHCGERSDKETMLHIVKGSSKYYVHEHCDRIKQQEKDDKEIQKLIKKKEDAENKEYRAKATSIFYEYTKSLQPLSMVNLAFKKCAEKGLTNSDILFTMEYIKKHQCVLRFPMGILYYIDRAMKEKQEIEKFKKQNERVVTSPIKIMPLSMKKQEKANDDYDISDLL